MPAGPAAAALSDLEVFRGGLAAIGDEFVLDHLSLVEGAEASPLDRIWGIGLAGDDERAQDPARWRGLNLLGFALMEARARLAAEK